MCATRVLQAVALNHGLLQESQRRGPAPLSPLVCKSPALPAAIRLAAKNASVSHENSNISLSSLRSRESRGERRGPKPVRPDFRPHPSFQLGPAYIEGGAVQRPGTVAATAQALAAQSLAGGLKGGPLFATQGAGAETNVRPSTRG